MPKQKKTKLKKNYDEMASSYDKQSSHYAWTAPLKTTAYTLHLLKPKLKILDIGVGTGQSIHKAIEIGCDVYGIDISDEMLQQAKQKYPEANLIVDDLENGLTNLKEKNFELVTISGVIEFVEDFRKALTVIKKLLIPKGYLCFTFELPKNNISSSREPAPSNEFIHYRRSYKQVYKDLSELNFTVVRSETFEAYINKTSNEAVEYHVILTRIE